MLPSDVVDDGVTLPFHSVQQVSLHTAATLPSPRDDVYHGIDRLSVLRRGIAQAGRCVVFDAQDVVRRQAGHLRTRGLHAVDAQADLATAERRNLARQSVDRYSGQVHPPQQVASAGRHPPLLRRGQQHLSVALRDLSPRPDGHFPQPHRLPVGRVRRCRVRSCSVCRCHICLCKEQGRPKHCCCQHCQ